MFTILFIQLLSLGAPNTINNDTINFVNPKVVIIVNNDVIRIADIHVVKYKNDIAIDTLFGGYHLGSFYFVDYEIDNFVDLDCDTAILNISVWNLKSSFKRAPTEHIFAIGNQDYWLTSTEHMRVFQFENMSIRYFRRKRKAQSKSGFYFILTNDQRHIESDRYVR